MNNSSRIDRSTLEDTLAAVNPLPPSPTQRDAIIQLIEGDQELIGVLKKERIRRQSVLMGNLSKVTIETACLQIAKADLGRAQRFHVHITNTKREAALFSKIALQEARELANASRSQEIQSHANALDLERAKISTVTTPYRDIVHKFAQEASTSLNKASMTVQYHQEALQGAQTLIQMAQKDLDIIDHQIVQLQNSVMRKKFALQAIWRVPDDIWILIFAYSTGTAISEMGRNNGWLCGETSWYGALVISMVCRRWRAASTTCTRLWSNIVAVKSKFKTSAMSRINHYLNLAQMTPKTLLIDNPDSAKQVDTQQWKKTWSGHQNIGRIVCRLQERGRNAVTARVLQGLPGANCLWLLRASETKSSTAIAARDGPPCFLSIPASFCDILKHVVTESVKINWNSATATWPSARPKQARLVSYTVDCPPGESMWPIDVFAPDSVPTLMDLRIRSAPTWEPNPVLDELITLPRVKKLHTGLRYLLSHISRRFRLPALASLNIVDAADATVDQYEATKPWIASTRIKYLVCESMGDMGPLLSLIVDLDALSSLELQGESITPILSSLTQYCGGEVAGILPSLKYLTISSYGGDGSPILAFLIAWKSQKESSPHLRTLNVTIFADECPRLSLEVRKEIISLAERRDRCKPSFL